MTNKEQLPEWRKALNSAVENYQSAQAWHEENQDSPSAQQDMDEAEGGIEKLLKQYGVLIVLSLMDELQELRHSCLALRGEIEDVQAQLYEAENRNNADDEELQERRKADSAEPLAWTDEEELRDLRAVGFCEMFSGEPISKDADIRRVIPLYRHAQLALVVPPAIEPDYEVIKSILPTANPDEYACCIAADMWNACRAAMLQGKTSAVRAPKSGEVSCG